MGVYIDVGAPWRLVAVRTTPTGGDASGLVSGLGRRGGGAATSDAAWPDDLAHGCQEAGGRLLLHELHGPILSAEPKRQAEHAVPGRVQPGWLEVAEAHQATGQV